MTKKYSQLTPEQRYQLAALFKAGHAMVLSLHSWVFTAVVLAGN
jgi:hypothetical protein